MRSREFAAHMRRSRVDRLLVQRRISFSSDIYYLITDLTELNFTKIGRDCMVGLRFQTSGSLRVVYRPCGNMRRNAFVGRKGEQPFV